MRVAVAGGTGWTGRRVVDALRAAGDEVVVLARGAGVDLVSGEGLAGALADVDAVVDVTNTPTRRRRTATTFFETVTTTLQRAEQAAGVRHHVVLSIVGCDRVGLGYYRAKRHQEETVLAGPVPATVLRATQFHEFAAQMLASRGPVVVAPRMLCQPIALAEVVEHLVDVVHGEPQGLAPELAGPEPGVRMDDMVVALARQRGDRRPRLRAGLPGEVGRQMAGGGLLPTADGPRGRTTFADWLASPDAARTH